MNGMVELAEEVFHLPARIGAPQYRGPLADVVCQPYYATAMGLVIEGQAQRRRGLIGRDPGNLRDWVARARAWLERNF